MCSHTFLDFVLLSLSMCSHELSWILNMPSRSIVWPCKLGCLGAVEDLVEVAWLARSWSSHWSNVLDLDQARSILPIQKMLIKNSRYRGFLCGLSNWGFALGAEPCWSYSIPCPLSVGLPKVFLQLPGCVRLDVGLAHTLPLISGSHFPCVPRSRHSSLYLYSPSSFAYQVV